MSGVQIEDESGVLVARLSGEIDVANARDIGSQLTEAVPNSTLGVVLDLSGTTYLDSSGVQFIFELAERLRRRQQQFRVVVPEGAPMRRVLRIVELDSAVPLDTGTGESVAAIRAAA